MDESDFEIEFKDNPGFLDIELSTLDDRNTMGVEKSAEEVRIETDIPANFEENSAYFFSGYTLKEPETPVNYTKDCEEFENVDTKVERDSTIEVKIRDNLAYVECRYSIPQVNNEYENQSEPSIPVELDTETKLSKEKWGARIEYTFNTIGFVVGLGNIWKFSSYCYEYGGGVFIPVYTLFYIILGLPVFLLELYMGQFTSRGCIECWGNCRLLRGVGVSTVAMGLAIVFPYVMFIVWALKYFVLSCYIIPPWSNASNPIPCNGSCGFSAYAFFWGEGFHLSHSTGIGDLGLPQWEFVVAGFFIWLIFFLLVFQGLKFSGKSVYFTVLFPYLAAIILLGHSTSLRGSGQGLRDYVSTDRFSSSISNYSLWTDAAIQIMFSLSLGQGGLTCLSSFNDLRSNLFFNAVLVTFIDYVSSLLFGVIVFAYIGYIKYGLNLVIPGEWDGLQLLFILVPQAISETYPASFWSALFFLLLIVLAFDVALTLIRTAGVAIFEGFPNLPYSRAIYINIGVCTCGFLSTIAMCTPGGVYFFKLIYNFGNSWGLLWNALLTGVLIMMMYGGVQITIDIEYMLKGRAISLRIWKYAKYYFIFCWYGITPIFLVYLLISKWIQLKEPFSYYGHIYPTWSTAMGWMISMCIPLSAIITWIIYLVKEKGPLDKRFRCLKNSKPGSPLWSIATSNEMAELQEIKRKRREKLAKKNDSQ